MDSTPTKSTPEDARLLAYSIVERDLRERGIYSLFIGVPRMQDDVAASKAGADSHYGRATTLYEAVERACTDREATSTEAPAQ